MISQVILKGKKVKVITQKYEIGLYVAVYNEDNRLVEQFGLQNNDEQKFHADLNKKYKKWTAKKAWRHEGVAWENKPLTWTGEAGRRPRRLTHKFFTGRRKSRPAGRGIYKAFPHLHPSRRYNPVNRYTQKDRENLKSQIFEYYNIKLNNKDTDRLAHILYWTEKRYENKNIRFTNFDWKITVEKFLKIKHKINPFKSKAQQRFMFRRHPRIARRWAKVTDFSKLPERVRGNPVKSRRLTKLQKSGRKILKKFGYKETQRRMRRYFSRPDVRQELFYRQAIGKPLIKNPSSKYSIKFYYVDWSSIFTARPYDINKIKKGVLAGGGFNIRTENLHGWSNQPAVVVFQAHPNMIRDIDKSVAKILGHSIIIHEKDWGYRRKNPAYGKPVEIYDKILAIEAVKGKKSNWANQPFIHKFGRTKSKIYGMPDGSLVIRGRKRLWAKKRY